jgi:hypothetical protein
MEGIEESKEIIAFVKVLAQTIGEAKADAKLDMFDAIRALKIAPSFALAVSGSGKVKLELADLTGEEKDLLINDIKDALFSLIEALV